MSQIFTLLSKEFLEIYRSKKLLILIILFAFVAISSPIIAKLIPTILKSMPATPGITIDIPEPIWKDAVDQFVKNLGQIGMIVIIFTFAGAVADEKSKKTLEIILTKPVSRFNFILAKFKASFIATATVFAAASLVFYFYTLSTFGSMDGTAFFWIALFSFIYIAVILALTLFFSAISKSLIVAVGLAFLTEIIAATFFGYIKKIADYSPAFINGNYKELYGGGDLSKFLPSLLCSIGAIIIFFLLSVFFFKKQEIER